MVAAGNHIDPRDKWSDPRSYKGEVTGRILVHGEETAGWKLSQVSQKVGTVLQDPERQILGTKVLNEVAFGLENLGLPRSEIIRAWTTALSSSKITDLRDRETFNLSGGEKQKVALAGVLAMASEYPAADEPLASLDPASAGNRSIWCAPWPIEGMTVLMIEHRVEDVLRIHPDRVMFLWRGDALLGRFKGLSKSRLSGGQAAGRDDCGTAPRAILLRCRPFGSPPRRAGPSHRRSPGRDLRMSRSDTRAEPRSCMASTSRFDRGDVIAVLGANGAGKTTLVKHAIGLLKPKSGRVLVEGRDTKEIKCRPDRQHAGICIPEPQPHAVRAHRARGAGFWSDQSETSESEIEKEVKEALRIVNLEEKEQDPPLALSFGQQKRVSIAAILAMRSRSW